MMQSVGAGTGSQCQATQDSQYTQRVQSGENNDNTPIYIYCTEDSNKRPTLTFTLTATPVGNSPPPSSNNEVRVAVKFKRSNERSLNWGGKLRLRDMGGGRYLVRMKNGWTEKSEEHTTIKIVNQKKGGKPPKGTLTITVVNHCYTKGGVERCTSGNSTSTTFN